MMTRPCTTNGTVGPTSAALRFVAGRLAFRSTFLALVYPAYAGRLPPARWTRKYTGYSGTIGIVIDTVGRGHYALIFRTGINNDPSDDLADRRASLII